MTLARPSRLHHRATVCRNQDATRAFYEGILGLPLVATWAEDDELGTYCHTFFELADGSALAFFQFVDPADHDELASKEPNTLNHVALAVDAESQAVIADRLNANAKYGRVVEHGYCRSLYTEDPNGMLLEFTVDVPEVDEIAALRSADAHETLKRWLAGDHSSNNMYR